MDRDLGHGLVLLGVFAGVGAFLALLFLPRIGPGPLPELPAGAPTAAPPVYGPPRLADAPEALRPEVAEGRRLMGRTARDLGSARGNTLSCDSCHFEGGRTEGARNGGLSLVGSAARYPRVVAGALVDLPDRINACLTQAMAGDPLPPEAPPLRALTAWIHWIGAGVPQYAEVPWLALPGVPEHPKAGLDGAQVYLRRCAVCHGDDGAGTAVAPALWGTGGFTADATMARPEVLTAFAYWNMPRENPLLSPDEATAVARHVLAQPRVGGG